MTGREKLRSDALKLADRYRELLTPPGGRVPALSPDRIEHARQVARDDQIPGQLTLDECLGDVR